MKKLLLSFIFAALLPYCPGPVLADDWQVQAVGPFGTINNTDPSLIIPAEKAQDALNVDVSPGGKSVKKREGYGLAYSLETATSAVHGIYNFFESGGSDVSLFFSDTWMEASVGGSANSLILSTGPLAATWQCVDSQGFAYCANTSRTGILKTNGTTFSFLSPTATGYIVAVTPERLVQAGFASFPNRIDFSKANDFNTWTIGASGTDPINFTITAPGAKITHITYAFDRLMWFKDSSFGYILIGSQDAFADWQIVTVSPNLGTNDNTSVYWNDTLYFRGQDGHIYAYDGSSTQKLTREITETTEGAQTKTSNSWTQTSLADWLSGDISADMSSSITAGSLTQKTTYFILTSSTDWSNVILSTPDLYSDTTTISGSLQLVYPDPFDSFRDGSSSTKNVWTKHRSGPNHATISASSGKLSITTAGDGSVAGIRTTKQISEFGPGTTFFLLISDADNNFLFALNHDALTDGQNVQSSGDFFAFHFRKTADLEVSAIRNSADGDLVTCTSGPCTDYAFPAEISIFLSTSFYSVSINGSSAYSGSHSWGNEKTYAFIEGISTSNTVEVDMFGVAPIQFSFTSPIYDTGIVSPVWSTFTVTSSGDGSLTHATRVSSDGSTFDGNVSASPGSLITSSPKRYLRFSSTFTATSASGANLALADVTVSAGSSGTFKSAVKNAPSITSWDAFSANRQEQGGSMPFYIRSATNSFAVTSSTPSWTALTVGSIPTVSTGTYFQIRTDLTAPNTFQNPVLNDFTVNWFEGSASDKSYATYFDNRILWSVASGAGATGNNYTLVFDLLNEGWLLYDIGANGFLVRNQDLYFGDPDGGYIYRYGGTDSDNGSAINAYWKSKDFIFGSPFHDKEFVNLSVSATSVANSSATVTYTVDGSSSTAYTVSLYDSRSSFLRNNKNLPLGRVGQTMNVQFGNNAADQSFEVFGLQIGYRPKSWRPTP